MRPLRLSSLLCSLIVSGLCTAAMAQTPWAPTPNVSRSRARGNSPVVGEPRGGDALFGTASASVPPQYVSTSRSRPLPPSEWGTPPQGVGPTTDEITRDAAGTLELANQLGTPVQPAAAYGFSSIPRQSQAGSSSIAEANPIEGGPVITPTAAWETPRVRFYDELPLGLQEGAVSRHDSLLFGTFLSLAVRNIDTPFAAERNGAGQPIGRIANTDLGYNTGFRVGGGYAMSESTSMLATFTSFDASATDSLPLPLGNQVFANLVLPGTPNTQVGGFPSTATSDFSLNTIDIVYRRRITPLPWNFAFNYRLGGRWTSLDQDLQVRYPINAATDVLAKTSFTGGGPRIAFDAERIVTGQLMSYFQLGTALLAGTYETSYQQTSPITGQVANLSYEESRFVPVLEAEVGVGWKSASDRFRIRAGYQIHAWFNTATPGSFASNIAAGSFAAPSETILLDGLTLTTELRW